MADLGDGASIILGGQLPQQINPLDAAMKAMTMKDLVSRSNLNQIQSAKEAQDFNDNQTMRKAISDNTKIDPNGNATVDQQGAIKQVAQTNPAIAPKMQMDFNQKNLMAQKNQIEMDQQKVNYIGQLAGGVSDADSYQDFLTKVKSVYPDAAAQMSPVYSPSSLNQLRMRGLDLNEQFKQQNAQIDEQLKGKQLGIDSAKLGMDVFKTYGNPIKGQQMDPNSDPSDYVSKVVPPDRQGKALDEIEAAQNTARSAPKIVQAFDNAAAKLHATDFVPGTMNADQKAMHALLGPTFKDVEGTVRQAAMDNLYKNTTPAFGDSKQTIQIKRAALLDYLQSKTAAPTNKSYGIDLKQFKSTSIDPKTLAGPQKSQPYNAPALGSVVDGHRFTGGDPSKQENWEDVTASK